jgi:hypothetical protein
MRGFRCTENSCGYVRLHRVLIKQEVRKVQCTVAGRVQDWHWSGRGAAQAHGWMEDERLDGR